MDLPLNQLDVGKRIKFAIWGSCVSREILNYCNEIDLSAYVLQNPIHTMFSDSFTPYAGIKGTSNFATRCLEYECSKTAYSVFQEKHADYLMIDTCDCRNNYYEMKDNSNCKICQSLSAKMNFGECGVYSDLFNLRSVFDIDKQEWDSLIKMYCHKLLDLYDEKHIVLNEFSFAKQYIKDGMLYEYDNWDKYQKQNELTSYVASVIKTYLPNILVIDAYPNPIGNYYHHLGNSGLHFTDEVYIAQSRKLYELIGFY